MLVKLHSQLLTCRHLGQPIAGHSSLHISGYSNTCVMPFSTSMYGCAGVLTLYSMPLPAVIDTQIQIFPCYRSYPDTAPTVQAWTSAYKIQGLFHVSPRSVISKENHSATIAAACIVAYPRTTV